MPTEAQLLVRNSFKASCDCFGVQPKTGGATPPETGPRNRSWWYNQSQGSGLFYYNYFMKQTIPEYLYTTPPDWCISAIYSLQVQPYAVVYGKPCTENPEYYRNYAWLGYLQSNYIEMPETEYRLGIKTYSIYNPPTWAFGSYDYVRLLKFTAPLKIPSSYCTLLTRWYSYSDPTYGSFNFSAYMAPLSGFPSLFSVTTTGTLLCVKKSTTQLTYQGYSYIPFSFPSSKIKANSVNVFLVRFHNSLSINPIPPVRYTYGETDYFFLKDTAWPSIGYILFHY